MVHVASMMNVLQSEGTHLSLYRKPSVVEADASST
jgi:hypothetical protein